MTIEDLQNTFLESVLSAEKGSRLDIYRTNEIGIRVNALKLIFPKTLTVVGEDAFEAIATDYVVDVDSTHVSLDDEGTQFLERWTEVVSTIDGYSELQYLPDLVKLERHIHNLRFIPTGIEYDWKAAFEREDLDKAVLEPAPNIVLFWSNWSLISLYEEAQEHSGWLVVKVVNGHPVLTPISGDMATLIQSHDSIGVLHNHVPATLIQTAISSGWISRLRFPEEITC